MDSQPSLRLILEVDLGSDPIGGHLEGPDGDVEFGWLSLASALEQFFTGSPEAGSGPPAG